MKFGFIKRVDIGRITNMKYFESLTFRAPALLQREKGHLILEMSAFQIFQAGNSTFSALFVNTNTHANLPRSSAVINEDITRNTTKFSHRNGCNGFISVV